MKLQEIGDSKEFFNDSKKIKYKLHMASTFQIAREIYKRYGINIYTTTMKELESPSIKLRIEWIIFRDKVKRQIREIWRLYKT